MDSAALLAILLAFVAIDATVQGGITLRNRLYVPPSEQPAINRDLHLLAPLLYTLLLLALWLLAGWQWAAAGALLRVGLFDPIMNLRKHDPLFSVGYTAQLDRLLRTLAGSRADILSAGLRVLALAAAGAVLFVYR